MPTPAPSREPVDDLGRRLTLAAALDRALLEDALKVPSWTTPAEERAERATQYLATLSEDERHRRIDRALRLLSRTEELATALGLGLPA